MKAGNLLELYPNRGLRFVRGDGAWLEAADGRRYLDLMSNYGVSLFGYGHPVIVAALRRQIELLSTLHGSFTSDVRIKASLALARRLPMESPSICWSNSGAEAVEAALKLAVVASGRKRFVACKDGYHGKTMGALAATHAAKYRAPFEPLPWHVEHVQYGDGEAMRRALDDRTAAVILEPILGEGGIVVPPAGYLGEVRRAASDAGALMIVDEIQSGCGRTGKFLAVEHDDVSPDIVCLGKGLAGGIPVGATAVTGAVAARIPRGLHTSTFGGNPLACAGVLAVLALLGDEQLARVSMLGEAFMERMRTALPSPAVRGRGLMVGVAAGERRDAVLKVLQREGILAIPAGSDVVRFLPPYVVSVEDLFRAADVLAAAWST